MGWTHIVNTSLKYNFVASVKLHKTYKLEVKKYYIYILYTYGQSQYKIGARFINDNRPQ